MMDMKEMGPKMPPKKDMRETGPGMLLKRRRQTPGGDVSSVQASVKTAAESNWVDDAHMALMKMYTVEELLEKVRSSLDAADEEGQQYVREALIRLGKAQEQADRLVTLGGGYDEPSEETGLGTRVESLRPLSRRQVVDVRHLTLIWNKR